MKNTQTNEEKPNENNLNKQQNFNINKNKIERIIPNTRIYYKNKIIKIILEILEIHNKISSYYADITWFETNKKDKLNIQKKIDLVEYLYYLDSKEKLKFKNITEKDLKEIKNSYYEAYLAAEKICGLHEWVEILDYKQTYENCYDFNSFAGKIFLNYYYFLRTEYENLAARLKYEMENLYELTKKAEKYWWKIDIVKERKKLVGTPKENEIFKIRTKELEEEAFNESMEYIKTITAKDPNPIFEDGSCLENFPNYNEYVGE